MTELVSQMEYFFGENACAIIAFALFASFAWLAILERIQQKELRKDD